MAEVYNKLIVNIICDKDLSWSDGQSAVPFRKKGSSSVNQESEKCGSVI